MKFVHEYRDASPARNLAAQIKSAVTKPWMIMEISGGKTHTIVKTGIAEILPPEIRLGHSPVVPSALHL